jgi:hypothetical protein
MFAENNMNITRAMAAASALAAIAAPAAPASAAPEMIGDFRRSRLSPLTTDVRTVCFHALTHPRAAHKGLTPMHMA